MTNTLYLRKMGMNDSNLKGDVKNHRVRVLQNIDVMVSGEKINMFFEFGSWDKHRMRYSNKRTGEPLKHPVWETVNPNSFHVDTEYEKEELSSSGKYTYMASYRNSTVEKEIHEHDYDYTRANILKAVNAYAIKKYDKVVFIDEAVDAIVEKNGGWREKHIRANDSVIKVVRWDDDYKVLEVYSRDGITKDDSFQIELNTGRITN